MAECPELPSFASRPEGRALQVFLHLCGEPSLFVQSSDADIPLHLRFSPSASAVATSCMHANTWSRQIDTVAIAGNGQPSRLELRFRATR